jgi:spermidine/putrescine transport system permease protein
MSTAAATMPRERPGLASRVWRLVKRHALTAYAVLAIAYLLLPIFVVILFSFNAPKGKFNYVWQGFTLDNWKNWDNVLGLRDSVVTSIEVGLLATVVATALGTLIAMAIVRHHFVGRSATNILVFLPMSTPEIVLGASLLTLFLNTTSLFQLGFVTIFIAHVMFIVSFVVVTVKARLIGFDRHLEEAAMDLGANELTTFRKITLPLSWRHPDVPDLRLGHRPGRRAAAGERGRERNLPGCDRDCARPRDLAVPARAEGQRGSMTHLQREFS